MVTIFLTVTLQNLLKNCRNKKKSRELFFIILVVPILVCNGTGLCASFTDIKKAFEQDFGRINPESIKDHFKSIVEDLSGMNIEGPVPIEYKPRGDVKNEWFLMEMERSNLNSEAMALAYEFLLKRLQLLPKEKSLKKVLMASYDDIYGLYDHSKKVLYFSKEQTGMQYKLSFSMNSFMQLRTQHLIL